MLGQSLAILPFPNIDPIAVSLGPLAIHWYGLSYVVSILLGWQYARSLAGNERIWPGGRAPITREQLDDFLIWAVVGVVLGGRLGYVLFYDLPRFAADPLDVLAIWSGGMSFHGGAIGTIAAMVIFSRVKGIATWPLLDLVAACVPIGLFFGRVANFINAELYGGPSDLPWAMIFPTDPLQIPRHPSQLYEAILEGLVLFALLRWLTHSKGMLARPGFVGGAFIAGYGVVRTAVEFVRVPDVQIGYLLGGWFTMGMLLCLPMILFGAWCMWSAKPVADVTAGAVSPKRA